MKGWEAESLLCKLLEQHVVWYDNWRGLLRLKAPIKSLAGGLKFPDQLLCDWRVTVAGPRQPTRCPPGWGTPSWWSCPNCSWWGDPTTPPGTAGDVRTDCRLTLLCCRYSVEFDDTPKPQEPSNYLDNNSKAIQWVHYLPQLISESKVKQTFLYQSKLKRYKSS